MFSCLVLDLGDDSLKLVVHELDALQRGLLEPRDLPLHQHLERHLRHEQCRPRALNHQLTHIHTHKHTYNKYKRREGGIVKYGCRTVALRMAVRMSLRVRPSVGLMLLRHLPKTSVKM